MIRVFPVAVISKGAIPSFANDFSKRHPGVDITADPQSPVVAADAGELRTDPCTNVTLLYTYDHEIYNYGFVQERIGTDRTVHVGEVIGRVNDTGRVHFELRKDNEIIDPYADLTRAPHLLIQTQTWWELAAKMAAVAVAGLGVGAVAASVYNERQTDPPNTTEPPIEQLPAQQPIGLLESNLPNASSEATTGIRRAQLRTRSKKRKKKR